MRLEASCLVVFVLLGVAAFSAPLASAQDDAGEPQELDVPVEEISSERLVVCVRDAEGVPVRGAIIVVRHGRDGEVERQATNDAGHAVFAADTPRAVHAGRVKVLVQNDAVFENSVHQLPPQGGLLLVDLDGNEAPERAREIAVAPAVDAEEPCTVSEVEGIEPEQAEEPGEAVEAEALDPLDA